MASQHDHTTEPDAALAVLERTAPPVTPLTAELRDRLTSAAREVTVERTGVKKRQLVLAAVVAPALVLVGAGAAYASGAANWWAPLNVDGSASVGWTDWATHPDASVFYTLPSGLKCELRMGNVTYSPAANIPASAGTPDPSSLGAVLNYLHSGQLSSDLDVAAVIQENRSDHNWFTDDQGNQVAFGYGTDHYNADVEYDAALNEAVSDAIDAHLASLGIASLGLGFQAQHQCAGTTP